LQSIDVRSRRGERRWCNRRPANRPRKGAHTGRCKKESNSCSADRHDRLHPWRLVITLGTLDSVRRCECEVRHTRRPNPKKNSFESDSRLGGTTIGQPTSYKPRRTRLRAYTRGCDGSVREELAQKLRAAQIDPDARSSHRDGSCRAAIRPIVAAAEAGYNAKRARC